MSTSLKSATRPGCLSSVSFARTVGTSCVEKTWKWKVSWSQSQINCLTDVRSASVLGRRPRSTRHSKSWKWSKESLRSRSHFAKACWRVAASSSAKLPKLTLPTEGARRLSSLSSSIMAVVLAFARKKLERLMAGLSSSLELAGGPIDNRGTSLAPSSSSSLLLSEAEPSLSAFMFCVIFFRTRALRRRLRKREARGRRGFRVESLRERTWLRLSSEGATIDPRSSSPIGVDRSRTSPPSGTRRSKASEIRGS
mmetsp:Transcript_87995/g.188787  ORF Transcript_87995/g.188787 Transcript_87995/m.188787 type:complete len:253 (-) Transcript_87995:872-1630(-)